MLTVQNNAWPLWGGVVNQERKKYTAEMLETSVEQLEIAAMQLRAVAVKMTHNEIDALETTNHKSFMLALDNVHRFSDAVQRAWRDRMLDNQE